MPEYIPDLGNLDMSAALSMGAETIDDRDEPVTQEGPPQGSALAQIEEMNDVERQFYVGGEVEDKPPGTPGWGMQWGKRYGRWHLVPVNSCVLELARDAEELYFEPPKHIKDDPDVKSFIRLYSEKLREFIHTKRGMNHISAKRKLQAEIDDASWLWCQAAKYKRDASEKMERWTRYGKGLSESQRKQLESLKEYGLNNIREGYIMSRGLVMAADCFDPQDKQLVAGMTPAWTYEASAKRVLTASCNKLTQYFEARSPKETAAIVAQTDKFEFEDHFYN